jgi:hypothetical protein
VQVLSLLAKDLGFRANGFGGPRQQAVDDCRYSQTMFRPDVVPCFIGFVRVGRARNKKGAATAPSDGPNTMSTLL